MPIKTHSVFHQAIAVEAVGDVDVLLLDKTGTVTMGNRQATDFLPAPGMTKQQLADAAQLALFADETSEERSIVLVALIPIALKGVNFRPLTPTEILARNLFNYGFGGILLPFLGIKIIDILITNHRPGLKQEKYNPLRARHAFKKNKPKHCKQRVVSAYPANITAAALTPALLTPV